MTRTRLTSRDVSIRPNTQLPTTARTAFAKAAGIVAATGALAGCGDTITNHYYGNRPDVSDTTDAGVCAPGPSLVCGDAPIQEYVRKGQTLDVGELHFVVKDVGDDGQRGPFVILSLLDPNCDETNELRLYRDQPTELASVLGNLRITLLGTYTPDGNLPGAVLKVEANCPEIAGCLTSGVAVAGIINQGESLTLGSVSFLLDDLQNQADGVYALLSVVQGDNTVAQLKIKEGSIAMVSIDDQTFV
ncbi:MAG: hypothetical protein ABID61_00760, partial [Candidatus Micrarchaeota archaeon]